MATNSITIGGSTSPRPLLRIELTYSSYDQSGNYSTWRWYLRYEQNGSLAWASDANHYGYIHGFATSGTTYFGIPYSWAGTNTIHYIGGTGYFTKGHNAQGYLSAGYMYGYCYVNNAPYVTSATVSIHSGTPPRIPKVPSKPVAPVFVSAESDSLSFTITASSDHGGSSITDFEMQVLDPTGVNVVTSWFGIHAAQTSPPVLEPDTAYRVRYRAKNGIGWSLWSDLTTMTTEAGIFVSDGTSWHGARITVSNGTDWVVADTLISNGSAWVEPVPTE